MDPLALLALLFSVLAASGMQGHAVGALITTGALKPSSLTHAAAAAAAAAAADGTGAAPPFVTAAGVKQLQALEPVARSTRPPATPRAFLGWRGQLCMDRPEVCEALSPGQYACCFHLHCADLSTEKLNCGKCGRKCRVGESCCGGECTDTYSDPGHCGECGRACAPNERCTYGMCGYA